MPHTHTQQYKSLSRRLDRGESTEHNEYMSINPEVSPQIPATVAQWNAAESIGRFLRTAREDEGMDLYQLSQKTGLDFAMLQLMELGVWIPTEEDILILADGLGCGSLYMEFLRVIGDFWDEVERLECQS